MTALVPEEVRIDATTGSVSPSTGRYVKSLSDLDGIFHDEAARAALIVSAGDPVVYEVIEYRQDGADLFFGTTIVQPGQVGDEYFMTRGHFHARRDLGEVYCTQRGQGLLLLETRDGRTETVDMRPGTCAFIPPDWAHRTVNTGGEPLVFTWFCSVLAGHDYDSIRTQGMVKRVVEREGVATLADNPRRRRRPAENVRA